MEHMNSLEVYQKKIEKKAFKQYKIVRLVIYCKKRRIKKQFLNVSRSFYSNRVISLVITGFKRNRVWEKSLKHLHRLLFTRLKSSLTLLLPQCRVLNSSSKENSSECVQKMTSFRIHTLFNTLTQLLTQVLSSSFFILKSTREDYSKFSNFSNFEGEIPQGTFQTSAQARSVLLKSENLCRRVSSLVDRLGSQYGSQDSCESVSSRINLHIPRGSINNTPLSPLSMGELDTDRISNKIEEVEDDIAQYDLVLKIWKAWKNWANKQIYSRENKVMANDFFSRRGKTKVFYFLKERFERKKKNYEKNVLARGSFVQKVLRKIVKTFKKWTDLQVDRKKMVGKMRDEKMKKILRGWKKVSHGLAGVGKKIREFRRKFDKKVIFKYFKLFVIISMILTRENKQKKIALDFNRVHLLKLGFKHISLSVFTNKYFNTLNNLALSHFSKTYKKRYFERFYLNSLTQKRVRVVKETGSRLYRKNHLIKAMRKFYSFCSFSKTRQKQQQLSENYYISSLYLKTFVSWQNYLNLFKSKQKSTTKSSDLFKKKILTKIMKYWKILHPKLKKLRISFENVRKEKKNNTVKDILKNWLVLTQKRREKMSGFEKRKSFKWYKKVFDAWKEFSEKRIEKVERNEKKIEKFSKMVKIRIFLSWKKIWREKRKILEKMNEVFIRKKRKLYKKWRKVFIRKITLTPLVLKRYCLFIFRRWKKYALNTRDKFKKLKKSKTFHEKKLKLKIFTKMLSFAVVSQKYKKIIFSCIQKRTKKTNSLLLGYWKSYTIGSRLKKLKILKSQNHLELTSKTKVFNSLHLHKTSEQSKIDLQIRSLKRKLISSNQLKPSSSLETSSKSLKDLENLYLKSKGLNTWFKSILHKRNKSSDISSILSNSLRIEVSASYFNKAAVEAIQQRRKKTAKKIIAHWRQFVDISKQKYQKSLSQYKKTLMKKVRRSFNSMKDFTVTHKRNKTLLEKAEKHLESLKTENFWDYWKKFLNMKKSRKEKILTVTKTRLSKLMRVILRSWKSFSRYKKTAGQIADNFRKLKNFRKVFKALKLNKSQVFSTKNLKADQFFISRFLQNWINFLIQKRKNFRIKEELKKKADEFFEDLSCVRALRRLKDFADNRILMKTANSVFFENSFKKVFTRWKGLHNRYYKKMRMAKMIESEKISKKKSFAIKKWFYVSHLNSWKNRAEKRLFFYWDRRLKRILFTWKTVLGQKKTTCDKIWSFRSSTLARKTFKALSNISTLKSSKLKTLEKIQSFRTFHHLQKGFSLFKSFHLHSKQKLSKLTKALRFRFFKTCEKFFTLWETSSKFSKTKKARLRKTFSSFIRGFGLSKFDLKPSDLSSVSKSDFSKDFEFLANFGNSLCSGLPKGRDYLKTTIFCKWRSLSSCHLVSSYTRACRFHIESLQLRTLNAWTRALCYAKTRRKTLRAAIIFHRTTLKKRVLLAWRPKKVLRRKK